MNDMVRIVSCVTESHDTKTFGFKMKGNAKAGQFVMVWIPGVDEVPMSLSAAGDVKGITVKAIGEATKALHRLKENDVIGIRGPYGNGFNVKAGKKVLAVGGGVGISALMPFIRSSGIDTVIGARNRSEVIMEPEVRRYSKNVRISTDDGSYGFKGNAVELMKEVMKSNEYDVVIGCGPEIMLYYLHKACVELNVDCQLSLERFMKCGAGLCGSCVVDSMRVCEDGPVFDRAQITELKEFGRIRRTPAGTKVKL